MATGHADPDEVDLVAMLRALGHPTRWAIVQRLAAEPETCACDFHEIFDLAQPTVSGHLKVLREAGVVRTRRRGSNICYSVRPDAVARLTAALAALAPAGVPA